MCEWHPFEGNPDDLSKAFSVATKSGIYIRESLNSYNFVQILGELKPLCFQEITHWMPWNNETVFKNDI